MNATTTLFVLLVSAISAQAHAGIILQNPPRTLTLSTPEPMVEAASGDLAEVSLTDCSGDDHVISVGAEVDLVQGWSVDLPEGEWCEVTLKFSSPLDVSVWTEGQLQEESVWMQNASSVLYQDAQGLFTSMALGAIILDNPPVVDVDLDQ